MHKDGNADCGERGKHNLDMDPNDLHPGDDHRHKYFVWHEWIQANGILTAENVFDYFAVSMFYDKQSNNQVLRMQTMHTGVPIADEAAELRRFTGTEFAIVHCQPPTFFVIHKRERLSPDEVRPLAAYFIINNRIYQAPDLYSVLSNRLLTTVSMLQASMDTLRKYRPEYTPRTGFAWPVADPLITPSDASKPTNDEGETSNRSAPAASTQVKDKRTDGPKRHQNTMLLRNALGTTAAHTSEVLASLKGSHVSEPVAETPGTATMRSSATPAPAPQDGLAKSASTATLDGGRSSNAGVKKKKKRGSVAPPA